VVPAHESGAMLALLRFERRKRSNLFQYCARVRFVIQHMRSEKTAREPRLDAAVQQG
jgi:hypothetical protein